ncbi:hypothetical protein [Streptomyces sp. NPDC001508]
MTWEIETIGGEEGEALARLQATVMIEVIAWIAEQRRKQGSSSASEQD